MKNIEELLDLLDQAQSEAFVYHKNIYLKYKKEIYEVNSFTFEKKENVDRFVFKIMALCLSLETAMLKDTIYKMKPNFKLN